MNQTELYHHYIDDGKIIPFKENRTSINLHCVKCGKYKSKKSKSKLCTACLFGKDFKKSFIQV